jgi:hypothetical protein
MDRTAARTRSTSPPRRWLGQTSPASTPSAARSSGTCCAPAAGRGAGDFRTSAHALAHVTVDSPDDLRTLAEYAESVGRVELATSMRLETPVYQPAFQTHERHDNCQGLLLIGATGSPDAGSTCCMSWRTTCHKQSLARLAGAHKRFGAVQGRSMAWISR